MAFGSRNEGLIWIRNSGAIDAAEWDRGAQGYVEGMGRDGGFAMPEGHWESTRLGGGTRRLVRVEAEREGFVTLRLVGATERVPAGVTATASAGRRWARFPPSLQGSTHRLRIRVPESLAGVASIEMVFARMDGPGR